MREIDFLLSNKATLWCDNINVIYLSVNLVLYARTKHVELNYHFVRKQVKNGNNHIHFLANKDQLTNIFTKPLLRDRFLFIRDKFRLQSSKHGLVRGC